MPPTQGWDNIVALSYAAEQLFMAAQLLTSDTVPLEYAVQQTCERHLQGLVQHSGLLPAGVNRRIRECLRGCVPMSTHGAMLPPEIRELALNVNRVLDEVRRLLSASENGKQAA